MEEAPYDVLVVGGGPVGMTGTAMLLKQGFSVLCLDRQPHSHFLDDFYDGRTLALSWGSLQLFKALGLKDVFLSQGSPIQDIYITHHGSSSLHYDSKAWGHPMGINVEMRHIRRSLFNLVKDSVLAPTTLVTLENKSGLWHVGLSTGEMLRARLLVGADGKNSWVRDHLGFTFKKYAYAQQSLVGVIHHSEPHKGRAFEHFTPQGPLALLPMVGQKSSLIWTVDPETCEALMNSSIKTFVETLQTSFGETLGILSLECSEPPEVLAKECKSLWSFGLSALYCPKPYGPRAVIVGDGAHTMHPVAGQGFNVGLRDVVDLVKILVDDRQVGLPWWQLTTLEKYGRGRQTDVLSMLGLTHGLVRAFSLDRPLIQRGLSLGLSWVNRIPPLKRFLCRKAMGL